MERLERPSLQDGIVRAGALRVWVESAWPPLVGLAGLMNYHLQEIAVPSRVSSFDEHRQQGQNNVPMHNLHYLELLITYFHYSTVLFSYHSMLLHYLEKNCVNYIILLHYFCIISALCQNEPNATLHTSMLGRSGVA